MSFRRVYENSPSEHKITNVGSENCDIILWKENLPDTGKALYLTVYLFIFFFHHGASIMNAWWWVIIKRTELCPTELAMKDNTNPRGFSGFKVMMEKGPKSKPIKQNPWASYNERSQKRFPRPAFKQKSIPDLKKFSIKNWALEDNTVHTIWIYLFIIW